MSNPNKKAVVIGSGVSGMSAALLLAKAGRKVTLIEAMPVLSPLLRGFESQGHQFDIGFHHAGKLTADGILKKYLMLLGVWKHLKLQKYKQDGHQLFRLIANGQPKDMFIPQGAKQKVRYLQGQWPQYKKEIKKFVDKTIEAFEHSPFTAVKKFTTESFVSTSITKTKDILNNFSFPPQLQTILMVNSLFYGTPPDKSVFEEFSLISGAADDGVCSFVGGGAGLAKAFEQELHSNNVKIILNNPATAINIQDMTVNSVKLASSKNIECTECVYTGHPSSLPNLLPENTLKKTIKQHLQELQETPYVFLMFAVTKKNFVQHRQVFICTKESLNEIYDGADFSNSVISLSCGTPNDQGYYPIMAATILSEELALKLAAHEDNKCNYSRLKQTLTDKLLFAVKKHAPELADLHPICSATPNTFKSWVYGSRGGIYGAKHSLSQLPVNPRTKISGLTLAGQGIILPGLLGTIISGVVATGFFTGFDDLFRELKCQNTEL